MYGFEGMSCTGEVGISPVLLQVISHTLTSSEVNSENCLNNNSHEKHRDTSGFRLQECKSKDIKPNILQVNANQNSEKKILPILHGLHQPTESLISQVQMDSNGITENVTETTPDLKAMLKLKLDQGANVKPNSNSVLFSQSDPNVVNVFTAINNNENKSKNLVFELNQTIKIDGVKCGEHEEVIVCFNRDSSSVPSPDNDVIVSDSDSGIVDASKKRHLPPTSDQESQSSPLKYTRLEEDESGRGDEENSNSTSQSASNIHAVYIHPEEIVSLKIPVSSVTNSNSPSKDAIDKENCPICSDKVSGYHYGIFSCESCKGFFKRTVQNKKVYQCHQKNCCEINVYNRKKCPACRFNKCLESGMLLEAIRLDRTRGGRSSYDGCSPHGRTRDIVDKQKLQKLTTVKPNSHHQQQQHSQRSVTIPNMAIQKVGQNKASQLVAILSRNSSSDDKKPFVPQILTDIMNLESLLCDDEPNTQILLEDPTSYTSLMQITEDRLYKIVRWARNLSQFASISTDDQILLLQNCWSDLLLLECCYRSKEKPSEIRLAQGATLSVKTAKSLGLGSVVSMVVELAEQLNRLKVDLYEFVGLKVLVLITPDVKGLKHPETIREHQEKLCEALDMYTGSHYPQHPNKFGEMILTLPILSRISIKGKELITDTQLNDISSYGLLYELLKGENATKESHSTPENT
ncbi:nuclear hormone receptor FTZ-F1 beta [Octopus bimaculoides]|uniref:nuclear hormone receptor FTZ-F1 beta n=1 Tax=Octopus bimaculoides TaxID=37653 RepID=UPI0022DF5CBE|nr:nuclear hormone receptor FTZ-F1 beta [Octopus bimaculoides]